MLNCPYHKPMRLNLALWCTLMLACTLLMSESMAHQQKLALTKVVLNPSTDTLEVMHRFELHDAEHAVEELFAPGADIMHSQETQQQFAEYVYARFGIYTADDTPLTLTPIGFEVEGKHFWVYQETAAPKDIEGLKVVHNALRDIWFAQTNTVNIEVADKVNTLTFTENTEVLNIQFKH